MFLSASCASNLTMQTAKILPEGTLSIGGAAGMATNNNMISSQYNGRPDIENERDEFIFAFLPWFMMSYGMGSGFDISLYLTYYAVEGGFKYQILNVGDFFLASGFKSYYGYLPDIIDESEPGIHSFDAIFPIYLSYDLNSCYAVYGSCRYIIRNIYSKRENVYTENSPRHLVSATLGNKIMNKDNYSIMFELSVNKDLGIDFYSTQFNVGGTQEY